MRQRNADINTNNSQPPAPNSNASNPPHRNVANRSYERDIKLAADIGSTTFRFSIEWARIEPLRGVFDMEAVHRCGGGLGA